MTFTKRLLVSSFCTLLSSAAMASQWQTLPENIPTPQDNPQTEEKVVLGKHLFFDPRLSKDGTISCNSCHNVMNGGEDNRPNSVGVGGQTGGRSAPTVWNSAFLSVQFWDGRAKTLEEQAVGPLTNPIEMAMPNNDAVMARIAGLPAYKELFEKAFGTDNPMTIDNVAKAIAAYERTLITPNSAYDKFVKGDKTALTAQQVKGMQTFAEVGCTSCHSGGNFSGPSLPLGTGFFMKFPTFADNAFVKKYALVDDLGRFEATKKEADKNMWRVPTLRNVALTAPYFHNGAVKSLDEAVRVMAKSQLNRDLNDNQVSDLVAFLNALTGEFPQQIMPRLPSSINASVVVK